MPQRRQQRTDRGRFLELITNVQLPSADTVHVGGSKRIDIGGGHWVWTKKVGNGDIKVLLLHGGPVLITNISKALKTSCRSFLAAHPVRNSSLFHVRISFATHCTAASAWGEPANRGPTLSVKYVSSLYAYGSLMAASRMRVIVAICSSVHAPEPDPGPWSTYLLSRACRRQASSVLLLRSPLSSR